MRITSQFITSATLTAAAMSALLPLSGCTVGPDYHAPDVKVAAAFSSPLTTQPAVITAATTTANTAPVNLQAWWEALGDPELNSLLSRAIASNLDLQIAVARLQQARASEAMFTGSSLPDVSFEAAAGRGTGTNSVKGRDSGAMNAATNTGGYKEITHVFGFDAVWEVDLFGHLRRESQVAIADTIAAAEYRDQVLITLLADVARNYTQVRSLQMRVEIAKQSIAVQQRSANLARVRYQRGLTNQLDVELAERELLTTQATLAPLQASLSRSQRSLSVLLGLEPDALQVELSKDEPLPNPPAEIAAGLPGELLRRRPDVRQAEAELIAANARIGVATSQLYPQVFLTAAAGVQGQGLGEHPQKSNFIDSIGPAVRWSILDFGTIDSQIQYEDQATVAALASYRKTVLTAVEEVDDALTDYQAQRTRFDDLAQAVNRAKLAVHLANQRYERGITDFLNVVDAQRALYALQDQYALSESATVIQFISVCKALGGGWENHAAPAPNRAPRPAIFAAGADILGLNRGPLNSTPP